MQKVYFKNYQLSIPDVDMYYRVTPTAILNLFQDIATEHAEVLDAGRKTLLKENAFWILSRISFKINKQLNFTDKLKLKTWVASAKTIYSDREYIIFNEAEEPAVFGTSKWCILNLGSRALRKVTDFFSENVITAEKFIDSKKIEIPQQTSNQSSIYNVRASDIDINMHMNNAKYADLIFNSFSPEEYTDKYITQFHINYLNEMRCGETIKINRWDKGDSIHLIEGVSDKPAFCAEVSLTAGNKEQNV